MFSKWSLISNYVDDRSSGFNVVRYRRSLRCVVTCRIDIDLRPHYVYITLSGTAQYHIIMIQIHRCLFVCLSVLNSFRFLQGWHLIGVRARQTKVSQKKSH